MNTVPFFLNEVQQSFMETINKDIELYNQGKSYILNMISKGRQQGFTSFIKCLSIS